MNKNMVGELRSRNLETPLLKGRFSVVEAWCPAPGCGRAVSVPRQAGAARAVGIAELS